MPENVFDQIHAQQQAGSPAATGGGGNVFDQLHAEAQPKGWAERLYEKTPLKPIGDALTKDLDGKSGVDYAKQLATNYAKAQVTVPADMLTGAVKSIYEGVAGDHAKAVEAASQGKYLEALYHEYNGAQRIGNPLNSSLIQDGRASVEKDLKEGNYAGAIGTLASWAAGDLPGMADSAVSAVKSTSTARAGVGGAARAVVPSVTDLFNDLSLVKDAKAAGKTAGKLKAGWDQGVAAKVAADEAAASDAAVARSRANPRTPIYERPDLAPPPAPLAEVAARMTPAELQAAVEQRLAENRAARSGVGRVQALSDQAPQPPPPPAAAIAEPPMAGQLSEGQQIIDPLAPAAPQGGEGPIAPTPAPAMPANLEQLASDPAAHGAAPLAGNVIDPSMEQWRQTLERIKAGQTLSEIEHPALPAERPKTISKPEAANRDAQSTRVLDHLKRMAQDAGLDVADLMRMRIDEPELFRTLESGLDKKYTGSAKQETNWRASTPEPSPATLTQIDKKLAASPEFESKLGSDGQPTDATGQRSSGEIGPVSRPIEPVASDRSSGEPRGYGKTTTVHIPGKGKSGAYPARYKVVELSDIQASHNGNTFEANPKYSLKNDRDYRQPENQGKVVSGALPSEFEPGLLITDNVSASDGPPVLDSRNEAVGGNGRTMMLDRVHAHPSPEMASAYRQMLTEKAAQFGIDPEHIASMKQPVLVRELTRDMDTGSLQDAITDMNKTGTASLKQSEQTVSDARRVSMATREHIADRMDAAGPDATLNKVLSGPEGLGIYNRLIKDGIVTPVEQAGYVHQGNLTDAAKIRIGKVLLGQFVDEPAMLDRLAKPVRNKLERIAAPLVKADTMPGWEMTPRIKKALALLDDLKDDPTALKNLDPTIQDKQTVIGGERQYSPEAIALAKGINRAQMGEVIKAAREYADHAVEAGKTPSMFGPAPLTEMEAYDRTFGKLGKTKKVSLKDLAAGGR